LACFQMWDNHETFCWIFISCIGIRRLDLANWISCIILFQKELEKEGWERFWNHWIHHLISWLLLIR
jgi:hypothetical protein